LGFFSGAIYSRIRELKNRSGILISRNHERCSLKSIEGRHDPMKNSARLAICALACLIFGCVSVEAQTISTVVGGGPGTTGLSATGSSIGSPAAVRFDSAGNMFVLDNTFGRVLKVTPAGVVTVYAGNGTSGFSGDNGPAINAQMNGPSGMCIDTANNLYIADSDNAVIREVLAADQTIHTVVGVPTTSNPTYGGDGAAALSANLHFPDGCAFDSHGNLYIADRANNEIRVVIGTAAVTPPGLTGPLTAGNIYRFAGGPGGTPGHQPVAGYGLDGSAAVNAPLNGPFDVFIDPSGNVFIADLGNNFDPNTGQPDNQPGPPNNNVIREVLASDGTIHTVAGVITQVAGVWTGQYPNIAPQGPPVASGAALTIALNEPKGLSMDAVGNLYFCDAVTQVVRKVTAPGTVGSQISVVAGTLGAGGFNGDTHAATSANLSFPAGSFVNPVASDLYIADVVNNAVRVVPMSVTFVEFGKTVAVNNIDTIAGNGHLSYGGDNSAANLVELNAPTGLAVDTSSNLYVADTGSDLVRALIASTGKMATLSGQVEANGFTNDTIAPSDFGVLNGAIGVVADASGNVYIADTANCIVRKRTGTAITTIAGFEPPIVNPDNPTANVPKCGSDAPGGVAVGTHIGTVNGIALDSKGNVFFSDSTNNVVWEVPATTVGSLTAGHAYAVVGTPSTTGAFGGDGAAAGSAQLNSPMGIYIDVYDNLFIADAGNHRLREVPALNVGTMTAGSIYTIAGNGTAGISTDPGVATSAQLQYPYAVVVDHDENVFFTDTTFNLFPTGGHTFSSHSVREVAGKTEGAKTAGNIYTIAGVPNTPGFSGDVGTPSASVATSAHLDFPTGVALIPNGPSGPNATANLLVSDYINNRVRSVAGIANIEPVALASLSPNPVTFTAVAGTASTPSVVTLTNGGGATLMVTAPIAISGTNASDFTETDNCSTPGTVPAGTNCTINVIFNPPTGATGTLTATLTVTDSALGGSQAVTLNGTVGNPVLTLTVTDTDPSSTQTVTAGATATYNLSVAANQAVNATITCTGAPTDATCTPAPASVAVTATTAGTLKVSVTTTARGELLPFNQPSMKMQPPSFLQIAPMASLALLFLLAMMLGWMQNQPGRMRLARVALSLCLILMPIAAATFLVGCGGGSSTTPPPPPPATGTPAGTYTITVTATSGSTTSTPLKLTLVVN
jgi:sugar lactone lactonase YvrE